MGNNKKRLLFWFELPHDKTKKMACAPSEDSDQPGNLPSLIRVFAVSMKKAWDLSYPLSALRSLCSDWADAEADLSLRWAHMPFCWFCHAAARFTPQEGQRNEEAPVLSPEELIKHPLQNRWAMWFFKNDKAKEWTANLKLVTAFDTVEDFWG